MNLRLSRVAMGLLAVAVVLLVADRCWAVFYGLGPSQDDWGLQYEVELKPAEGDLLNVELTVAGEGRLTPVYSYTVVAFSQPDRTGGRRYDVKAPIELKPNQDGKRVGQVQIRKEFIDRATIRVLTQTVDGKRQTAGAAYYDIPLKKFMDDVPEAATRPAPGVKATK